MKTLEHLTKAYTAILVKKIESFEGNYKKAWIELDGFKPRNIRGTYYNNWNVLFLTVAAEDAGYKLPIYMTFKQATDEKITILKGSKSHPVVYWEIYLKHTETKKTVKLKDWQKFPKEEQSQYKKSFVLKYYNVFNIDQTNFKEIYPDKYEKYISDSENMLPKIKEENKFYCAELDELILNQTWDCPIHIKPSNQAYYAFLNDYIVCPDKEQFEAQEFFYSTLLHEMAHSTGHQSRLDRKMFSYQQDKKAYATEELIAELTAAISGHILNMRAYPSDNNAAYLQSWLKALREEPQFLFKVLGSVVKAVESITAKVNISIPEYTEINKTERVE